MHIKFWLYYLTLYHIILTFNNPEKKPLKNIVEKGDNSHSDFYPSQKEHVVNS